MIKLKASEIAGIRGKLLAAQKAVCKICQLPCSSTQAVLDHCHATGIIRGVLHRGCNSLLGKVENNYKRYGVPNVAAFCAGVGRYLQRGVVGGEFIHPTFKTDEEKRVRKNLLARQRRAKGSNETT